MIGEGNGNPLQCSCLENPRDRGACWAAVYGVQQSQTQLMQLSKQATMFQCYHLLNADDKSTPFIELLYGMNEKELIKGLA